MPVALVIVHKTAGGHRWSNTHAVQIGATPDGIPGTSDLDAIGANVALTDANTSTAPTNFIQRLIAFERLMHMPDIMISDVYITDGREQKLDPAAGVYATLGVGLQGRAFNTAAGAALEPGALTLMIHRTGPGYSVKPGRMYIRGFLTEDQVQLGGPRMVAWEGNSVAPPSAVTNRFNTAVASGIQTHFVGGTNAATALYAIPHYAAARDVTSGAARKVGELTFVYPVNNLTLVGPVLRQVQRGRRRRRV